MNTKSVCIKTIGINISENGIMVATLYSAIMSGCTMKYPNIIVSSEYRSWLAIDPNPTNRPYFSYSKSLFLKEKENLNQSLIPGTNSTVAIKGEIIFAVINPLSPHKYVPAKLEKR